MLLSEINKSENPTYCSIPNRWYSGKCKSYRDNNMISGSWG